MAFEFKSPFGAELFDRLTQFAGVRLGSWAGNRDVISVSTPKGSLYVVLEGGTVRVLAAGAAMPQPIGVFELSDPVSFDELEKLLNDWGITLPADDD